MFQRAPGSVPITPGQARAPVVDRNAIKEYMATLVG
jgi:hypothetical protein